MRDERVELNVATHGVFHHSRQLRAPAHTAKGAAAPDPAGHQLEWACRNFLAGARHTNDDAFAPTLVAAFQRGAHDVDVANALKTEVHAAIRHLDNDILNGFAVVLGVDAVGGPHHFGQPEFVAIHVNANNAAGLGLACPLNDCQANATQAEDGHGIAGLDLGRVVHSANAGGHTATQQAHFFQRSLGVDLGQ